MDDLSDIASFKDWKTISMVEKGWSCDRKFRILTVDDRQLLLRVGSAASFEKRRKEFLLMKELAALDIVMPKPVDFGAFDGGRSVFTLLTWVEGADAELIVPTLPEHEQYRLGCLAGETLRRIHALPAPRELDDWASKFNRKIESRIRNYEACPIRIGKGALIVDFIDGSRSLLEDRPQSFQHGDYHIGNLVVTAEGAIGAIDFDRLDFGDPWEEFNRIVWCAKLSPGFASGRIDGYFGSELPASFFPLMALYIAVNALSSVPWALPFGDGEVRTMLGQIDDILEFYDDFRSLVPRWYRPKNLKRDGR